LLTSKNPAPTKKKITEWVPPKGYDTKAQAAVYLAIQGLLTDGSTAFDTLLAHFNDERYSFSVEGDQEVHNVSVGEVCRVIMVRTIQCADYEIEILTPDQLDIYIGRTAKGDLAKWWKANKHRPFWEIQVEALDDAIKFMESVDRLKCRKIHREAERLPPQKFEEVRKENLRKLKARRDAIASFEEPHRPKQLQDYDWTSEMLMVPWHPPTWPPDKE
jgi:hypothetical protein